MYSSRIPPEEPPCETCRIETLAENEEALKIFMVVRNQLISGPMSVIDINHLAIHAAMDLYNIKNRRQCFEKVIQLAGWWLAKIKEK